MKRTVALVAGVLLVLLAAGSVSYAAEAIQLKYSNYFPGTHQYAVLTGKFCEEIKKRTNGRVEITHYPGGTLTTAPKVFQGVMSGISDLGWSAVHYNQGRFPVIEATYLPLGSVDGYVGSMVADDFYRKFTPKEWERVHVLFLSSTGPNVIIHTKKTPVRTLEELKGMKIRGTGMQADVVKALGGVAMPLEMVDVYEAMRRGVLDGGFWPLEVLKGWKFGELSKYTTSCWQVGSTATFYAVMNKEKWNALPADIKKIFDEVSAEFRDKHAMVSNDADYEGLDFFKQHGGQLTQLSDAEAKKWEKAVEPVIADYKKDMASKGYKAEEVDSWIKYLRERINFWEQKAKDQGIKSPYQ
ncbi:MAG TPA: TRAP transporter substrate-binding protein [Syntrophorhabdales bacterium]|nr:TRAP transporter substrate-binding protein [Syntrophorhabdales bacterium]